MILGRVNFVCTPPSPRTDEVDPFFWPEPSYGAHHDGELSLMTESWSSELNENETQKRTDKQPISQQDGARWWWRPGQHCLPPPGAAMGKRDRDALGHLMLRHRQPLVVVQATPICATVRIFERGVGDFRWFSLRTGASGLPGARPVEL